MKHIFFACLSLTFLFAAGCQIVHVTDQNGKAVAWADVSATTQDSGATGIPTKTDLMGLAPLPMSQEAPGTREWLEIRKEGYITRRIVRPEDGKVEVQLIRAPGAPKSPDAKAK
ncbi:MAG: carboxypeptidase regulatory-like domain-containing protein [Phycisphaerae bacterium]|nr:carboxypeptidase regulatory-like domain-containing protein [Phycisphaerae bacterium]